MKKMNVFAILILVAWSSLPNLHADDLDPSSAAALAKTQQMLNDAKERANAIAQTPQAQFVDKNVQSLAGSPQNVDAIYGLSADIMGSLVQETNGDPAKMKALLDQAKNDPKAFLEKLTPEQRAKLQDISRRIPASAASKQPN